MNVWTDLPRPFLVLAPLEGVADTVFRQIVASSVKPDLFVTEFTSADGYLSPGRFAVAENFRFTDIEKPILAQIWGKNPDTMRRTAKELAGMGFAGIDLNMGCPDRTVVGHGCGAALINTPDVVKAVIQAVKDGIKDAGRVLPVSVKTRIGFKTITTDTWLSFLLEQGIDALSVHGRTAAELSKVPAHWDEIGKAVSIRDRMKVPTVIVGNGDVRDAKDAMEKAKTYGVDGVMIGRGIFANMWAFDKSDSPHVGTPKELLDIMERHVKLFTVTWGDKKNYPILKKFFKIYVNGFRGATEWRVRFMATNTAEEALALLKELRHSALELTI
jgi:nifR3 family TIM-barrel protein